MLRIQNYFVTIKPHLGPMCKVNKVNLIVKLQFNGLKSCPSKFKSIENGDTKCSKCYEFQTESPCHVLFECKNSLILIDNAWRKVKERKNVLGTLYRICNFLI